MVGASVVVGRGAPVAPGLGRGRRSGQSWTSDRVETNELVNNVRDRVGVWRSAGYPGITATTLELLDYWNNPERERRILGVSTAADAAVKPGASGP